MTTHVSKLKSTALAALAMTVIAGGATTAAVTEAEAQWRPGFRAAGPGWGGPRYGYNRGWRPGRGAAVAAGIVGGLAAGALIAGATAPAYAAPVYGPGYVPPSYAPSYYQPTYAQPSYGYEYQPTCYTRKVRQVVDYDTVVIRRVRVCE